MRRTSFASVCAPVLLAAVASAQATWTRLYPAHSPLARLTAAATYDSVRQQVLLFGGSDGQVNLADLWMWDGVDWTQAQVSGPPALQGAALVFDVARHVAVLFGGSTTNGPVQDTWEWDGAVWVQRVSAHQPPARRDHMMAYDLDRSRTVLFGGVTANFTLLADVWEWDGVDWQHIVSSNGPSARGLAAMAYDPSLGGVLLFGGGMDDTWRWDGAWHDLLPPQTPAPRGGNSLVADLARRRIILLGDNSSFSPDPLAMEWDGSTWQTRFVTSPAGRACVALAYDSDRHEAVLFGGNSNHGVLSDTWVYRTPNPADRTSYGTGCPGSIGTPVLGNAPFSLPWIGDSFTMQATNLAPAVGAVVFSTGVASNSQPLDSYGMPGCVGLIVPIASDFRVATAGEADWTLAVPNTTTLAGAHVYQQAFAFEPGVNAAGIVVSNGANLVIGIR